MMMIFSIHRVRQCPMYGEKFCRRYLSEESRRILAEGEKITKAMNHRPNILLNVRRDS